MIRFVLSKGHPFRGDEVRVVGDCEALGWWDDSWGRQLFGSRSKVAPPIPNETASLLIPVGKKTITFSFIAVRKNGNALRGEERTIAVPEGTWRLTDDGADYHLEKEPQSVPPSWPRFGTWNIFEAETPSLPSFAIRGPTSGKATKLMVYFHPLHGRLDKPATSVFDDATAPPAYDFWRCMEDTVILMPGCPCKLEDGEEVGSGEWAHVDGVRSDKVGQDLYVLIVSVRAHYAIEPTEVFGFGTSNGGYAILEMLGQFPHLFARAAAISPHIETPAEDVAAKIPQDVPLYIWHCINDSVCPSSDVLQVVTNLREEEKNVRLWMGKDHMSARGHTHASHYAVDRGMIEWLLDGQDADCVQEEGRISMSALCTPLRPSFQRRAFDSHSRWSTTTGWVDTTDSTATNDAWSTRTPWRKDDYSSQWNEWQGNARDSGLGENARDSGLGENGSTEERQAENARHSCAQKE